MIYFVRLCNVFENVYNFFVGSIFCCMMEVGVFLEVYEIGWFWNDILL